LLAIIQTKEAAMTFVFRISSFAFVVVLATKTTLMVMDNQHSASYKSTHNVIHLLDEAFKHREELREASDDVVFSAQAVTIMAVRVIDSCVAAVHRVFNKIRSHTVFSAMHRVTTAFIALYTKPDGCKVEHQQRGMPVACASNRGFMWNSAFSRANARAKAQQGEFLFA
jgi:hypothetical protein